MRSALDWRHHREQLACDLRALARKRLALAHARQEVAGVGAALVVERGEHGREAEGEGAEGVHQLGQVVVGEGHPAASGTPEEQSAPGRGRLSSGLHGPFFAAKRV
jgi:hypothetical protein